VKLDFLHEQSGTKLYL